MWSGTEEKAGDGTDEGLTLPLVVEVSAQQRNTPGPPNNPAGRSSTSPKSLEHAESQSRASDVHREFIPSDGQEKPSSWSTGSDQQLASPDSASDRVFPIRSVISVDPTQTPSILQGQSSNGYLDYFQTGASSASTAGHDNADASHPRHRNKQSVSDDVRPTAWTTGQQELGASSSRSREPRKSPPVSASYCSDEYGGGARMQLFSDAASEKSFGRTDSTSIQSRSKTDSIGDPREEDDMPGLVTARFKHIVTDEGHAVITGRDGEILQRCEDEP